MNNIQTFDIRHHAQTFNLPPLIVQGIIKVESDGNPYSYRAEPAYRYLFDIDKYEPFRDLTQAEMNQDSAPVDFPWYEAISSRDTEWYGQQCSWGPMQVMGAVARERGFRKSFPELCSFDDGVYWGCSHLRWLADRYLDEGWWASVISAYNQGSPRRNDDGTFCNQEYVDKVCLAIQDIAKDSDIVREIDCETPA